MAYPNLDALDWASIQPCIDALLAADLSADGAPRWLKQWSGIDSVLYEAQVQVYRATIEDTTSADADRRFTILVDEIVPKMLIAQQALHDKLLAVPGYRSQADYDLRISPDRAVRERTWRAMMAAYLA